MRFTGHIVFFPGIVLHELAHYVACALTGTKTHRIKWWGLREASVQHSVSGPFRNILISMIQRYKKMISRVCDFSEREGIRLIETLYVTYKDKRSFVKAYTGNVSGGGLFIKTKDPLEKGVDFLVKLELPGLEDVVVIKCEVIWTRKKEEETDVYPAGMGVKFIEMTKDNNKILKKYLRGIEKKIADQ